MSNIQNFQNVLVSESAYVAISSVYINLNRAGAAYAMGYALYSENWDLFIRLWNDAIPMLAEYFPDQPPIYTGNIEAYITEYDAPLSIAADGSLSIVV